MPPYLRFVSADLSPFCAQLNPLPFFREFRKPSDSNLFMLMLALQSAPLTHRQRLPIEGPLALHRPTRRFLTMMTTTTTNLLVMMVILVMTVLRLSMRLLLSIVIALIAMLVGPGSVVTSMEVVLVVVMVIVMSVAFLQHPPNRHP